MTWVTPRVDDERYALGFGDNFLFQFFYSESQTKNRENHTTLLRPRKFKLLVLPDTRVTINQISQSGLQQQWIFEFQLQSEVYREERTAEESFIFSLSLSKEI